MKLCCWNINGIRAINKKDGFVEFLQSYNPDIILFQETKINDSFKVSGLERYTYQFDSFATKKGYSGVTILSKYEPISVDYNIDGSNEGRTIVIEFKTFYIINVYVMNSGSDIKRLSNRLEWDSILRNKVKSLMSKKPVIIAGDFNSILDSKLDYHAGNKKLPRLAGLTSEEVKSLQKLVNLGFTDAYRSLHPDLIKYSYYNYRTKGRLGWLIDRFFVDNRISDKIISCDVKDQIMGSDHRPIVMNIDC